MYNIDFAFCENNEASVTQIIQIVEQSYQRG